MQELQQQHGDQCCPNLRLDGVFAGADEGLDLEVLLQRLEEQFDLPAEPVDAGEGAGRQTPLIGQQDDLPLLLLIPDGDAPQAPRTLAAAVPVSRIHSSRRTPLLASGIV